MMTQHPMFWCFMLYLNECEQALASAWSTPWSVAGDALRNKREFPGLLMEIIYSRITLVSWSFHHSCFLTNSFWAFWPPLRCGVFLRNVIYITNMVDLCPCDHTIFKWLHYNYVHYYYHNEHTTNIINDQSHTYSFMASTESCPRSIVTSVEINAFKHVVLNE